MGMEDLMEDNKSSVTVDLPKSWAATLRQWWDELFPDHTNQSVERYTNPYREHIEYLQKELAQARIDRDKLQTMLNTVTPAGLMAQRAANPPKRPEPPPPTMKRWAQIEAERYAQINEMKKKAMQEHIDIASPDVKAA